MKMNICFLIDNISRSGGSERATSIIANELSKHGYNITILNIWGNNKSYYPLEKSIEVETLFLNKVVNHKLHYFNILRKVKKFYKKNKIDISIDIFASLSLFTIPIKKKLKFKNITWEHSNYYSKIGMNKISRKIACKFSDGIVTLTKEDLNYYRQNEKIRGIITNIYNPSVFSKSPKYNSNSKNIISVGRLSYEKGFDLLINVWELIEKNNGDWNLNIYGEGDKLEELNFLVKQKNLKRIHFCGATKNIIDCYNNSSIYVMTSRFEGLPMVLIEAQSQALPIVSFNCKTGPSEIVNDGVNGFLIENFDVDEFSKKLLFLMNDKDKRIEFSKNSDVSKFNVDKIIIRWIDFIKKLVITNVEEGVEK